MTTCKENSCNNSTVYSWACWCSYHERCLNKLQQYTDISNIHEIETFETWFNGNCGWVINYDSSSSLCFPYNIWIVVYEPAVKSKSEKLIAVNFINNYSSLPIARDIVQGLKKGLKYRDNPIFYTRPSECFRSFSEITKSPYVERVDLPYEKRTETQGYPCTCYPDCPCYHCTCNDEREIEIGVPCSSPGSYLKPLDIVKIKRQAMGNKFYHFGIYLGNEQVCHYSDPNSKKNTDNNQARITSWETFVRGCVDGEVIGYHVVIPFKNYREIARSVAWDEANNYGNLRYCLANNNCEHYVNSRIFGLNWSEQVAERPSTTREKSHHWITTNYEKCNKCKTGIVNNGKSGSFNLGDELNQSFNKTDNYRSREIERQYLQEVPPKENCRVM